MKGPVLVTGGAGFIGSHLLERLLGRGYTAVCLDNFDGYYSAALKRENLRGALAMGQVRLAEVDIRDREALRCIFAGERFQAVVHLAARPGVRPSFEDPLTYLEVNVGGTLNLLEACKEFAVPRFVLASSSAVYGRIEEAAREECTPCRPLSPYGASKVAAEALCSAYSETTALSAIVLRLFTAYGPRQRPDMAISRFTHFIASGQEVPIYGEGRSLRDYTFVSDILQGIEAALEASLTGFQVFNLGRGRPVALLDVIALIEEELKSKARLRLLPEQPGEAALTCADVTKASALLRYRPAVSIEDGIARYVRWFKETRLPSEIGH